MKGGDSDSDAMEVDSHTNGLGKYMRVSVTCVCVCVCVCACVRACVHTYIHTCIQHYQ